MAKDIQATLLVLEKNIAIARPEITKKIHGFLELLIERKY
jgi:hypothetical protein